jgi:hypothetical protein
MSLADASIVGGLVVLVVMHLRCALAHPPTHLAFDDSTRKRLVARPHCRTVRPPYDWSQEMSR